MLVRWLCSFPASTLLAQVGRFVLARHQNCLLRWVGLSTLVLPRPQGNAPLGNQGSTNRLRPVQGRPKQRLSRWSCCHWILGKECTLTPSSRSESELLDLHGPRGPRPTGNRGGLKKAKAKANGPNRGDDLSPIQRRLAKDLQITKLGDDQERRP